MGALCGKQSRKTLDKTTVVYGYCRLCQINFEIDIADGVKDIIAKYFSFRDMLSSNNIVSDKHIDELSKMNIICVPRGTYEVGGHKLMIYSDANITKKLKSYFKENPSNLSVVIGEMGLGMGFTSLLCYRVGQADNGAYFYDSNAYYQTTIGGMNGLDRESSDKSFIKGEHLEYSTFCNICEAANDIWRKKQQLLGNISWSESDDKNDPSPD